MRMASGTVLGLATLVASPALWQSWTGALPLDVALTRYLVAVVVVWAALSAVAMLVGVAPSRGGEPVAPRAEDPSGDRRGAGDRDPSLS